MKLSKLVFYPSKHDPVHTCDYWHNDERVIINRRTPYLASFLVRPFRSVDRHLRKTTSGQQRKFCDGIAPDCPDPVLSCLTFIVLAVTANARRHLDKLDPFDMFLAIAATSREAWRGGGSCHVLRSAFGSTIGS